jgi:hypothetical protein
MAGTTPRFETLNRPADDCKGFAASQTGVDLTAQSGKPACAAQMLELCNQSGAAIVAGLTLVADDGTTITPFIPPNWVWMSTIPIKTLTTPTNVTAIAYWWDHGCVEKREHTVARNP